MKKNLIRRPPRPNDKTSTVLTSSKSFVERRPVGAEPSALKFKRILVPVDFSPASVKAVKYALTLAKQFEATICLLHVIEKASFINDLENVALAVPDEKLAGIAKKHLISLARKVIKRPRVPVFPHVRIGKPFVEIVTLAQTRNIDLIVIATHGYTGLKHTLLGSTAERVVRHAPCPVLVVRQRQHDIVQTNTQRKGKLYENQTNIETRPGDRRNES